MPPSERYADATREQLLAVVAAADRLYRCQCEFPDSPGACSEYVQELDTALARCPGTSAWHWAQQPLEEI